LGASERALLQRFERLSANRFEEVNNYSDRLTRRFRDAGMTMKVAAGERDLGSLCACGDQRRRGLAAPPRAGTAQRETAHALDPARPAFANPERLVVEAEQRREVRRALNRLPQRTAAVLMLRHSGLSYAEVATALGIKVGNVGTLLRRAEEAMRKEVNRATPE